MKQNGACPQRSNKNQRYRLERDKKEEGSFKKGEGSDRVSAKCPWYMLNKKPSNHPVCPPQKHKQTWLTCSL